MPHIGPQIKDAHGQQHERDWPSQHYCQYFACKALGSGKQRTREPDARCAWRISVGHQAGGSDRER